MNGVRCTGGFPFRLAKIIAVVYLLLVYPLACVIPFEMTWENGPVENFQVVVLLLASLINLRMYRKSADSAKMYLWQAVFFFILAARELSWGRVFFQVSVNEYGPSFIKLQPDQKMVLHTVLGVVLLWLLVNLIRWVPWKRLCGSLGELPWLFVGIIVACVALANIGEKGLLGIDIKVGQGLEELAEINMYFCLCCLSAWYGENFCEG